jgi:hypothetical protein
MRHALPAALLFTSLAAPLAHAQCTPIPLIFNGDFEIPAITNNTFQPFTPTGWTWAPTNGLIFRGQPAPIWPVAASGAQYVDIGNAAGSITLRQTFTIDRPRTLRLSWNASAATGAVLSPYRVSIVRATDFATRTLGQFSAAGPYPSGQSWTSEISESSSPAGTFILQFEATGIAGGFDTLIDNVRFEALREPGWDLVNIVSSVSAGETLLAAVSPLGDVPATIRWQLQLAEGTNPWVPLVDGPLSGIGIVSGSTTSRIEISNAAPGVRFYLWPFVTNACGESVRPRISAIFVASQCNSIDFNQNGVFPEDQDVIDFFNVLSGADCPACNDIDFNNNGVFPEDQDVIDFFTVLAGGSCP